MSEKQDNSKEPALLTLERLAAHFERTGFKDYIDLQMKPWKMIWVNFLGGIGRGFGMAVGFTVVVGLAIYFTTMIIRHVAQVPIIGAWIADIVRVVQDNLQQAHQMPR